MARTGRARRCAVAPARLPQGRTVPAALRHQRRHRALQVRVGRGLLLGRCSTMTGSELLERERGHGDSAATFTATPWPFRLHLPLAVAVSESASEAVDSSYCRASCHGDTAGQYSVSGAVGSCSPCAAGANCTVGAVTNSSLCSAGYYSAAGAACAPCPAGSFSSAAGL